MKIRAIALNTFASLVRNKLLVLCFAVFTAVILLMMSPLLMMRTMARTNPEVFATEALTLVGLVMSLVSGFGSLLAAWSAADSVAVEIRSGTILAVLARPVRRWEFLLGKYLGVQLLMVIYVVFMLCVSYLLAWIGGTRIQAHPWTLVIYPLVRYAVYSALALLLSARMHPVLAFGAVLLMATVIGMVSPGRESRYLPAWLARGVYVILPSTQLLSEDRFLMIQKADLKPIPWSDHAITLTYGLDYAVVCFLGAAWLFRRRSLTRD
jgi:ABC-type transport system involved in multi-copper enzyme maturation permease subunit